MLPCFKHWRFLELQQCLGFLSGGILLCFDLWRTLELHQCWDFLIVSAIHSCRNLKCTSSLFAACGGGDLGNGGITSNRQFLEDLVLGRLGLLCGVSTPVAVPTGGVTPHLVRCPEAAVLVALSLSLDGIFQSY
jgi:hypothetical protein